MVTQFAMSRISVLDLPDGPGAVVLAENTGRDLFADQAARVLRGIAGGVVAG